MKSGSIIAMPFVKAKCAIAVKTNMTDMAILADKVISKLPETSFVVNSESINEKSKTNNGFISFGVKFSFNQNSIPKLRNYFYIILNSLLVSNKVYNYAL